jgi:hypothetical protein
VLCGFAHFDLLTVTLGFTVRHKVGECHPAEWVVDRGSLLDQQFQFFSAGNGFGAAVDIELAVDELYIPADCLYPEDKAFRNCTAVQTVCYETQVNTDL